MGDTTRIAKALVEFGVDKAEWKSFVRDTAQDLAGLSSNFRATGSDLDKVASGMSAAGKEASASTKLIAGMSSSGRTELERLSQSAQQPVSAFSQMKSMLAPMQAAIAGAFTVQAVVGFVREVGAFAGHMNDLSDETHISTTRLQAWNLLTTQAGLSVDDFTMSITQLQKRLADPSDGATAKLHDMGLNVQALIDMNPDDAFINIAEAVSHIGSQSERTATMMELFGRSGSRMLRLVSDDLGKLVAETEHSGAIIDDSLIKKADAFGDAWDRAWIQFRAGAVASFGLAAGIGINDGFGLLKGPNAANGKTTTAKNIFDSAIAGPTSVAGPTKDELRALDEQTDKIKKNAEAYDEARRKAAEWRDEVTGAKALADIKELEKRFLSLTDAQKNDTQTVQAVLAEYEKLEARVGLGVVPALDTLWQTSLTNSTVVTRALRQELMLANPQIQTLQSSTEALIPPVLETNDAISVQTAQLAEVSYAYAGAAKQQGDFRVTTISAWTEIDTLSRSFEQLATISGPTMSDVSRGIGSVTAAASAAHTGWGSLMKGFDEFSKDGKRDILGALSGIVGGIGGIVAAASAAVQGIKALINAFKSEETLKVNNPRDQFQEQYGGVTAMGNKILDTLMGQGLSYEDAEARRRELVDNGLNGARTEAAFNKAEDAIIDLIGGNRFAAGGIVTKPTLGLVGEAGPEAIIPINRLQAILGVGRDTVQHITFKLGERELTRVVARGLPRELHLSGVGL